jgi:hypothetical protein
MSSVILRMTLALTLMASSAVASFAQCGMPCCVEANVAHPPACQDSGTPARTEDHDCCDGKKNLPCDFKEDRDSGSVSALCAVPSVKRPVGVLHAIVPPSAVPLLWVLKGAVREPEALATPPPGPIYLRNLALLC